MAALSSYLAVLGTGAQLFEAVTAIVDFSLIGSETL